MAFATQGADLIAGDGMRNLLANGTGAFAAIGGGHSRYETGSHIDVDGASMLAGAGWSGKLSANRLSVGGFFEAGWGNYDSYNSFNNTPSVHGDGDTDYYGGGVLARLDLANGMYVEGSARMGYLESDFNSKDLSHSAGRKVNYDTASLYYGLHAGLGYLWQVNEASQLDFNTRYLWAHVDSDEVIVAGDVIQFSAANSQRWRNGVRYGYTINPTFTPYAGLADEYEFDGDAKARTYGFDIDSPSLEGGTGIGELGLTYQPTDSFSVDVAIQGYVGTREGVTGSAQLKYKF